MFKGYQNSNSSPLYRGFPNLNFQTNVSAYGFSGVYFWLDASFGLNTQTNLAAVSRWQPIIGRSAFVQDTAANQPRFIASDVNYNNLPSVQSVGNRSMIAQYGLQINQQFTIAIVSKVDIATTVNGIIGTATRGINDGGTRSGFNGFGVNTNFNTQTAFQGTTESTNTRIKIMSNNNIIVNGVSEYTGTLGLNEEFDRIFLSGGSDQALTGSIAEIIAFNFAMTSQQCIDLSNNINQKYALY